ncbi:MAG: hypothetical protein V1772_12735, partial [Chloroflexota bacterium]
MPSKADLVAFYDEQYPRSLKPVAVPARNDLTYAPVIRQVAPYLRLGLRALDVGCHTGAMSLYLAEAGCQVLGLDLS